MAAILIVVALAAGAAAQTVGVEAPPFTLVDLDGHAVQLSEYRGMPVVVNFWATWCGPCKAELPVFQRAVDELDGTVAFIMLNHGERYEIVSRFLGERGLSLPVALSPSGSQAASLRAAGGVADDSVAVARRYHVYGLPTTLLIDEEGILVGQHVGPAEVEDLASLLAIVGVAWSQ